MLHIPLYLHSEGDWIAAGRCYTFLYIFTVKVTGLLLVDVTLLYILTVKVTGLLLVDAPNLKSALCNTGS